MKRLLVRGQPRSGTTILTKLLYSPGELCTTNELYLYDFLFRGSHARGVNKTNKGFLKKLESRFKKSYKYIPEHMDVDSILKNLDELVGDETPARDSIRIVEAELFQGRFATVGDKVHDTITDLQLDRFEQEHVDNLKVVWIYRDGRDVCSSCRRAWKRLNKNIGPERANLNPWATDDMVVASNRWANRMLELVEMEGRLQKRNIPVMRVRFEDFIECPDEIAVSLAEFVGMSPEVLRQNISNMFSEKLHHFGYYTEWIPDWKEQFTARAKFILEAFGYK